MARAKLGKSHPQTEATKLKIGEHNRWWHSVPANKIRHSKATSDAHRLVPDHVKRARMLLGWVNRRARIARETVAILRREYGIPEGEAFMPARYSEHLFARSLISGSKADVPARQHKRFYYPYQAGIFPSEGEEFGVVNGELVPLVTVNGVTRAREEKG